MLQEDNVIDIDFNVGALHPVDVKAVGFDLGKINACEGAQGNVHPTPDRSDPAWDIAVYAHGTSGVVGACGIAQSDIEVVQIRGLGTDPKFHGVIARQIEGVSQSVIGEIVGEVAPVVAEAVGDV